MAILLFLATLVSGTAALVAEVVWFRALGRGVGTSAEALAVVSASFLGGLGIGAAVAIPAARSHQERGPGTGPASRIPPMRSAHAGSAGSR